MNHVFSILNEQLFFNAWEAATFVLLQSVLVDLFYC